MRRIRREEGGASSSPIMPFGACFEAVSHYLIFHKKCARSVEINMFFFLTEKEISSSIEDKEIETVNKIVIKESCCNVENIWDEKEIEEIKWTKFTQAKRIRTPLSV